MIPTPQKELRWTRICEDCKDWYNTTNYWSMVCKKCAMEKNVKDGKEAGKNTTSKTSKKQ